MERKPLLIGAALGAVTSLAVIGLMFLGWQWFDFPFVPFDIFDWMARVLPGNIVTFGIDTIVSFISLLGLGDTSGTAKLIEQTIAVGQLVVGGAVFGALVAFFAKANAKMAPTYGLIGGLLLLSATLFVENFLNNLEEGIAFGAVWLAILMAGWGWVLGGFIKDAEPSLADKPEAPMTRRQFLGIAGAGSLALGLASIGLGSLFGGRRSESEVLIGEPPESIEGDPFGATLTSGEAASPAPEELAARFEAVPGTRPELTPTGDFYRIDINTGAVPRISLDNWRLVIGGLVENELELSMGDLRAMPAVTQILTMQCISNYIGGDLTGTTRWTGVRFKDVLASAGVLPEAQEALIRSADDFFEGVKMPDIMDERTLLVYDMDGKPLPEIHGFPLRVYIPNRYGMKQPKWIESIHLVDENVEGYWVKRGWSKEAFVRTTSVVDTVQVDMLSEGEVRGVSAGGIAWSGARGISKVEVQVDDGPWQEAELRSPPLSPLSWVQWRYIWPNYLPGTHEFRVRCYEGDGELQITEDGPPRPDGATGIHTYTVRI